MLLIAHEHTFSQLQKIRPFQSVLVCSFDEFMGTVNKNRWSQKLVINKGKITTTFNDRKHLQEHLPCGYFVSL